MTEESLMIAALERRDPADRLAFLLEACSGDENLLRRVEAMIDAQGRPGTLPILPDLTPQTGFDPFSPPETAVHLTPPPISEADPTSETRASAPEVAHRIAAEEGTEIGPYTLIQTLGEGGMGVVFLAQQDKPVRRKVALKVIKAGMDTQQVIARFDAERRALALMEHPGIARVLDAGVTEAGRPYFVMELVKGTPITEYCDARRLTPRQRIELLIPICQAVQHAHQKGIIHRDLKPSNILVADVDGKPMPKVIDFGVAKAIDRSVEV